MKTQIMITNEGDLEHNVRYVTKLALEEGGQKKLSITFPSEETEYLEIII